MAVLAHLVDPVHGPVDVVLDERDGARRAEVRFPGRTITVEQDAWVRAVGAAAEVVKQHCPHAQVTLTNNYASSLFGRLLRWRPAQ